MTSSFAELLLSGMPGFFCAKVQTSTTEPVKISVNHLARHLGRDLIHKVTVGSNKGNIRRNNKLHRIPNV